MLLHRSSKASAKPLSDPKDLKRPPKVYIVLDKHFTHAQGWSHIALALKARRSFVQIGFTPPNGNHLWSRICRNRLQPLVRKLWIEAAAFLQPQALFHFPWGDDDLHNHAPCRQFIFTLHQPHELWRPGTIDACRKVAAVQVMAEREAALLRSQSPGIMTRCVRLGIDVSFWRPPIRPPSQRMKRIVFSGRYLRNIPMFMRLVRRLVADRSDVEVEMLLHQEFTFPPELLPLPPRVRFVGPFSAEEMRDFFQSAWLMLMPYDNVTSSHSICEALATGLPFFTTRVGGMESYAKGGMVLFENNRDDEAYAAVVRCLDDPDWRASLSQAARAAAVENLAWDVIAAEMESFYAEVAEHLRLSRASSGGARQRNRFRRK